MRADMTASEVVDLNVAVAGYVALVEPHGLYARLLHKVTDEAKSGDLVSYETRLALVRRLHEAMTCVSGAT